MSISRDKVPKEKSSQSHFALETKSRTFCHPMRSNWANKSQQDSFTSSHNLRYAFCILQFTGQVEKRREL